MSKHICHCGRTFTKPQGLGLHLRHVRDDPGHHPPGEHTGWATVSERVTEQPPPKANDKPAVWPLVVSDMKARDAEGRRKYGVPLQPFNGRDVLVDAYQEALDLCVYLRQAIYERDGR